MEWLTNPEIWIGLITLTALEIILGIDNVVFISILAGKLPEGQQSRARRMGLSLALLTRILLLLSLAWVIGLTTPIITLVGRGISGRDIILIGGGLFLITKSTLEIHNNLEASDGHANKRVLPSFASVIIQILLLDVVFSLDSVITAVGMVKHIGVMIAAVSIAMALMLISAEAISSFVTRHPTIKILALSFLLLIGMSLAMEGLHQPIPKGYIYFAMAFSIFIEMINLRVRAQKPTEPIQLRQYYTAENISVE
ncbi:MAG: TerC family protein [Desulfobacteraceae bacterium]|nr:TerC family protein [Desulfobacteraceae bacterium]